MRIGWFFLVLGLAAAVPTSAQEPVRPEPTEPPTVHAAADLVWRDGPQGRRVAVLHGDPSGPGSFVIRVRFPADQHITRHWHPGFEHVTVLEGSIRFALGEEATQENATSLEIGDYAAAPAGTPIEGWVGPEGALVQVHGEGPFEVIPLPR